MKKHILFIVENTTVPFDFRVWAEARAAKEFGYDVSVICPVKLKATLRRETMNGIEIHRHPMPIEADGKVGFLLEYLNALLWELFLSAKIFLRKPFHIIHSANPPDHVFIIAWLFKLCGVKYIFDHHDLTPENYLAKFGTKNILFTILLIMEKLTFKTADIVISTNQSYKQVAINRGNKSKEDVFVVRNGPDLSNILFMKPNRALINGFDYLVAYVGVIGKQEGIENLLSVAKHIVNEKKITNIRFMVVGTGPHWDNMVQLSKEMKLEKYVKFTGYIPYRDFYEVLATADVCVNPEFRNEFTDKSTMIKIMDYMVFGKPIVQFETTEGRVTAGNAALYIKNNDEADFAEALIGLLGNSGKRKRMGEIGRKRIHEKLCWDKQKGNLQRAYAYLEKR